MNALTIPGGTPLTMSSKEIADLTEKEHKNVIRDIRTMLNELKQDGSGLIYVLEEKDTRGYTSMFHLDRELADTLLTGYSAMLRRKVVARWHQLERMAAHPMVALNDPAQMRTLLLGYTEQVIELKGQVAELAPKAAALDRIATETEGAICLRLAAKLAQVPEKQYLQFLNGEKWIFRHHHSQTWAGYSEKEQAGYLELKRTKVTRDDGSEKTVEQVLITPRGQAKAAELIERKSPWLKRAPGACATLRRGFPLTGGHPTQPGAQL